MSEINKISKMSFSELLKIEFMKCKRSKIVPLICLLYTSDAADEDISV